MIACDRYRKVLAPNTNYTKNEGWAHTERYLTTVGYKRTLMTAFCVRLTCQSFQNTLYIFGDQCFKVFHCLTLVLSSKYIQTTLNKIARRNAEPKKRLHSQM